MKTQSCYKGRTYTITTDYTPSGNQMGKVSLGDLLLSAWSPSGRAELSLEDALEEAHRRAEALQLSRTKDPE